MSMSLGSIERPLEARSRRRGESPEALVSPASREGAREIPFDALDAHFEQRDHAIKRFRSRISALCRPSIFQTLELYVPRDLITTIAAFHKAFTRLPEDATYREECSHARALLASAYEQYLHAVRTKTQPRVRELQSNLQEVSDLVSDGWYAGAVRRHLELETSLVATLKRSDEVLEGVRQDSALADPPPLFA